MSVNHEFINMRRSYKTAAHAKAMQSIGGCLNDRLADCAVGGVGGEPLGIEGGDVVGIGQDKVLTQYQQEVLSGIVLMLDEMVQTADQVNIQSGTFGLSLPRLVLYEVSSYRDSVYRLVADAAAAAEKTGVQVVVDRLVLAKKELANLRKCMGE